MGSPDKPALDTLFQSNLVYGLNKCNFEKFINSKDLVMVMYYEGDNIKQRIYFAKAAGQTSRANHAYAAVNCVNEKDLCKAQMVCQLPAFKLYRNSKVIDSLSVLTDYRDLKDMVEAAPRSTFCNKTLK